MISRERSFEGSTRYEHEIKKTELFYAIDFDRCVGNTEELYKLLVQSLAAVHGDGAARSLDTVRQQVEATGGSFDVIDHLVQLQYDISPVAEHFLDAEVSPGALYELGAEEFLATLRDSGLPFAIVTYGGMEWQLMKLARMKMLDIPHLILSKSKKGNVISGWQTDEDEYSIPNDLYGPMVASRVVLIDDKPRSFVGLPESSRGYLIRHPRKKQGIQNVTLLPGNITQVHSFAEIAYAEDLKLNIA